MSLRPCLKHSDILMLFSDVLLKLLLIYGRILAENLPLYGIFVLALMGEMNSNDRVL